MLILAGTRVFDLFMGCSFLSRVFIVGLLITPVGLLLGTYFPLGLRMVGKNNQDTIAWAWGLNCGFSVLGSILSIIIAQFSGFDMVLLLACMAYVAAAF